MLFRSGGVRQGTGRVRASLGRLGLGLGSALVSTRECGVAKAREGLLESEPVVRLLGSGSA